MSWFAARDFDWFHLDENVTTLGGMTFQYYLRFWLDRHDSIVWGFEPGHGASWVELPSNWVFS